MIGAIRNNPTAATEIRSAELSLLDECGTVEALTDRVRAFTAAHDESDGTDRALRQHAKRKGSIFGCDDDMVGFHFELPPTTGRTVSEALLAEAQSMWRTTNPDTATDDTLRRHPQLLADAFVALIERAARPAGDGGVKAPRNATTPSVVMLFEYRHLVGGLDRHGVTARMADGTPLSAETVMRYACQHGIIPAIFDAPGYDLYLGRRVRLASDQQRLVLEAEWGGCAICGIDMRWCQIHHVDPWTTAAGTTDIDRLIPLCTNTCHHLVHEARWRIELPEHGIIELFSPDGRHQQTITSPRRQHTQPDTSHPPKRHNHHAARTDAA